MSEFLTEGEAADSHAYAFNHNPGHGLWIRFTTFVQPLAHQSMRATARGFFKPKNVVSYQKRIAADASLAVLQCVDWKKDATYSVSIRAYFRDKRRRDVDNVVKPIHDALNGIAWNDDSQVQLLSVAKFYDKADPRVVVLVQQLLSS